VLGGVGEGGEGGGTKEVPKRCFGSLGKKGKRAGLLNANSDVGKGAQWRMEKGGSLKRGTSIVAEETIEKLRPPHVTHGNTAGVPSVKGEELQRRRKGS